MTLTMNYTDAKWTAKKQSTVILIIQMLISLRSPLPEPDHWHCSILVYSYGKGIFCVYHFELSESVQRHLNQIAGVQIFTTTHNTDLMSNDLLRPDSYFLLANNSIKAISQLTEKELRQAHNLQKMYKAGAFNGK